MLSFPGSELTTGPLADPALNPNAQLQAVLEELNRARKEWADACTDVDKLIEKHESPDRVEAARARVRGAYARWSSIVEQANELGERARRAVPTTKSYQRLYDQTLQDLKDQFDGGPHYDLLCERVAGLHVRLKQMEAAGRAYPPAEHARLNGQLLQYVNQLQKYTEAMKSESLSREAQDVAERLLQVVERVLATSHPELWRSVVHDVRQALESAA